MALSDPLSLENSANAAKSFTRTGFDSSGSNWIDTSSSASEPRGLKIKHQVSGRGKDAVDRHLLSFYVTQLDADGVPRTAVVNTTVAVPRSDVITSTHVYDLIANCIDLLTAGQWAGIQTALTTTNVDKLLRGEQ